MARSCYVNCLLTPNSFISYGCADRNFERYTNEGFILACAGPTRASQDEARVTKNH